MLNLPLSPSSAAGASRSIFICPNAAMNDTPFTSSAAINAADLSTRTAADSLRTYGSGTKVNAPNDSTATDGYAFTSYSTNSALAPAASTTPPIGWGITTNYRKFQQISQPSMTVMFMDGPCWTHLLLSQDGRISFRHQNMTLCNVLLADGHVESVQGNIRPGPGGRNYPIPSITDAGSNPNLKSTFRWGD